MAPPTNKSVRPTAIGRGAGADNAELTEVRLQLNQTIAALRILTAKLDLDAGVTDVNYATLVTDAAATTAPAVVATVF